MITPSPIEQRRRSALRYWNAAENARLSARVLWLTSEDTANGISEDISGSFNSSALIEAFNRESAVALELVIKTVIAQRIENGTARRDVTKVRPTHDLRVLWGEASLPALPKDDLGRLIHAKYVLLWTGRYPAPRRDEQYDEMSEELKTFKVVVGKLGKRNLVADLKFAWDDFDRIYQTAADVFRAIVPFIDDDGWLIFPEGRRSRDD